MVKQLLVIYTKTTKNLHHLKVKDLMVNINLVIMLYGKTVASDLY